MGRNDNGGVEKGKAVFRRSQLLDAAVYRDDLTPVFIMLTEDESLRAGNAFMRRSRAAYGSREFQVGPLNKVGIAIDAASVHHSINLT